MTDHTFITSLQPNNATVFKQATFASFQELISNFTRCRMYQIKLEERCYTP